MSVETYDKSGVFGFEKFVDDFGHKNLHQQSENDDTYEQIIEQPHTTNFQSQINHFFLAHDEPTNWIPSPFTFPSSQCPKLNSHHPTFCFPATLITPN